jgi:methyl-accepting chemotaxis protein
MQYLEPKYQGMFIFKVCAGGLLIILAGGVGLFYYLNRPFSGGYLATISVLDELQRDVVLGVLVSIILQLSVFALLIFGVSLFWTHKVAGPLYRLKNHFGRIAAGDLTPMAVLRQGDQLRQIPELLNKGLDVYGNRLEETARQLQAAISEIENLIQCCQNEDIVNFLILRKLEESLQEIITVPEGSHE